MKIAEAKGIFYRVHSPRWASEPLSGAGAAKHGGRLNRAGVSALYLAADSETALAEYKQVSVLLPPGTIASYQIELTPVVDFTAGYVSGEWDPIWEDFFCDWRKLAFADRIEPPSWVISDLVQAAGAKGVLFPSATRPGGSNLVIYTGMVATTDKVTVYDPASELPTDQSSWAKRP